MWSVSESGALNGKSEAEGVFICVRVCATVCDRLLSCVERLPVSGRLSWVFFLSGLLEQCQQPEGIQAGLA